MLVDIVAPGGHLVEPIVWLLVTIGFFEGPLKLLGASWFAYLLPDALAALVLFIVFAERIAGGKPLFARSGVSLPIVLLGVWCLVETLNPESPLVRSLLGLRSWLLYLALYFVGLYTFRSVRQLERLYGLLLTLGLLTAAYGVYQWRAGPESFASWSDYYGRLAKLAWSAQSGLVFRAFSTFVAPGTFGTNMALLILLAFGVIASEAVPLRWRAAAAVAAMVMGAGIVVSGSRGPVVHLALAGAVMLVFLPGLGTKLRMAVRVGLLAGLVALVVLVQVGSLFGERLATIGEPESFFWKWFLPLMRGLDIALAHPLGMGLGYTAGVPQFIADRYVRDLPTTNVDSGYGSAAAELGLLGLLLFVYFAMTVGIEGLRAWRRLRTGHPKDLLLGPALIAGTYPIVSVIAQPQATLPSSIYVWLLVGMIVRASTLYDEDHADRVLRSSMRAR